MRTASRHPSLLESVETLFLRHDGPLPANALDEVVAGGDAGAWRRRAFGREINRAARELVGSIAARRTRLAGLQNCDPTGDPTLAALSRSLGAYRELGMLYRGTVGR